jgi:prepilin peptidase CpaA
MGLSKHAVWLLPALFAAIAGFTDWRSRRIPNWLTIPGLVLGILVNSLTRGWPGAKDSLLGAGFGLLLLFPFVYAKGIGMGDLKFVTALGAFLGPADLIPVLAVGILVNGAMALVAIVLKGRVRETAHNIVRVLAALFTLHLPDPEITLDNPRAVKVPFGVAVCVAVLLFTAGRFWGLA